MYASKRTKQKLCSYKTVGRNSTLVQLTRKPASPPSESDVPNWQSVQPVMCDVPNGQCVHCATSQTGKASIVRRPKRVKRTLHPSHTPPNEQYSFAY